MTALVELYNGATYVADDVVRDGPWIEILGCWRRRYGTGDNRWFRHGPRCRYVWNAREVRLIRWEAEPEVEVAA